MCTSVSCYSEAISIRFSCLEFPSAYVFAPEFNVTSSKEIIVNTVVPMPSVRVKLHCFLQLLLISKMHPNIQLAFNKPWIEKINFFETLLLLRPFVGSCFFIFEPFCAASFLSSVLSSSSSQATIIVTLTRVRIKISIIWPRTLTGLMIW